MKKLLLLLLILLTPCGAYAADIDCDDVTLQSAISAASDGAEITCKAGTFNWANNVTIPNTKGLTITGKGYGEGGTIITLTGKYLAIYLKNANSLVTIQGFKFVKGAARDGEIVLYNSDNPPVEAMSPMFRITNNYFDFQGYRGYGGINIQHYIYGLIDNNVFENFYDYAVWVEYKSTRSLDYGAYSWLVSQSIGTNRAVYVENNTFNGQTTQAVQLNHAVSGNYGAKYVARYNTLNRASLVSHSGCSADVWNPIWIEQYNNAMVFNGTWAPILWFRSVSGIMWNNAISSNGAPTLDVDFERGYTTSCRVGYSQVNAICDGTRSYDENASLPNGGGWRCHGQPGYGPPQTTWNGSSYSTGMDKGYVFSGVFAWGNLRNGSAVNIDRRNMSSYASYQVIFGREVFNAANMTVGGSKPATCTYGATTGRDIYIDTTDATKPIIWQCSATNTWTQHWTPYTCPHPLAGAGECTTAAGRGGYVLGGTPPIVTATSSVVNAAGGNISASQSVESGNTAEFSYEVHNGWSLKGWGGTCGGSGTNPYTTNALTTDCTVTVEFDQVKIFP